MRNAEKFRNAVITLALEKGVPLCSKFYDAVLAGENPHRGLRTAFKETMRLALSIKEAPGGGVYSSSIFDKMANLTFAEQDAIMNDLKATLEQSAEKNVKLKGF